MSGGAQAPAPAAPIFTDPVNGMSFGSAEALNEEIRQRQAQEQGASDTAAAKAASDKQEADAAAKLSDQQLLQRSADALNNARNTTRSSIHRYFYDQGYDPNRYGDAIEGYINGTAQGVDARNENPLSAFDQNAGSSIVSQLLGGARSRATQSVNNAFAPNYADENISNSWLGEAIDPLLKSQFDPLGDQLSNAQKRGTLNDQGYQAALKSLSERQTAGRSTLTGLGNNILAADRRGINDYITGAKNDAAGVDLNTAGAFDVGKYLTGAQDRVNNYKTSFAGDLSNALGSTALADIGSLLNAGGAVQGAYDPTVTGQAGAGAAPSDSYLASEALKNQKRGLGSQSSF